MRYLRLLLLALVFLLHTSFVAARSVHSCCMDSACTVAQCVQAGCLPGQPPLATQTPAALAPVMAPAPTYAAAPPLFLPDPMEDIWRPPD